MLVDVQTKTEESISSRFLVSRVPKSISLGVRKKKRICKSKKEYLTEEEWCEMGGWDIENRLINLV